MTSCFDKIASVKPIEVFFVHQRYVDEKSAQKVNGSVGAYRTEDGHPWVLPVVSEAERRMATDERYNHEYLPILGDQRYCQAATTLLLGEKSPAIADGRTKGVQCVSGTGSLRVGAEFLTRIADLKIVYMSRPTWSNHQQIFRSAGFQKIREYRYWNRQNKCIDIDCMIADLDKAPKMSVVILHACAHNPTGMDPTREQWKQIAAVIKRRKLFPFFDVAYQGFASGDPDIDAWAVRYFVEQNIELFAAQSFSKNFGLYGERVGNLTVALNDSAALSAVVSQLELNIRGNWATPPGHGSRIVEMVLTTPELRAQWLESIKVMSSRLVTVRKALHASLTAIGTPGTWNHVIEQIGMFFYTGLSPEQTDRLMNVHKVFLLKDGRLSLCGVNQANAHYVACAIDEVVRTVQPETRNENPNIFSLAWKLSQEKAPKMRLFLKLRA